MRPERLGAGCESSSIAPVESSATLPHLRLRARRLGDRELVLAYVGCALLLRLPFLATPLGIDEGGYAYVAANWGDGEGGLYGSQWVDRPPLLIALYAAAVAAAGDVGVRLLGCVAAAATVAACAGAARRIAGRTAMAWSGAAAMVLSSSTIIQSHTVNAELPAIACTSLAAWATVEALARARTGGQGTWRFAFAAGLAASCAVLVKQSFVDGLVFAGAVLAAALLLQRRARRAGAARLGRVVAGGIAGIAVALAATVAWAELAGPGTGELVRALYGFRIEARAAIAESQAPATRALLLWALLVLSGMLSLFGFVWIGLVRIMVGRQRLPAGVDALLVRAGAAGLLAMGAYGALAMSQGGNWWRHYVIQLVPMLAIGLGVVMAAGPGPRRSRVARGSMRVGAVVASITILAWISTFAWSATVGSHPAPTAAGDWLRTAARPGDTALVTWGHANVLRRSRLRTPYAHAWSLPIRVRDPQLRELRATIAGPDAPTWIVEWHSFGAWRLDDGGAFRRIVDRRYERVSSVCGRAVYRLRGTTPTTAALPPAPSTRACGMRTGRIAPLRPRW